MHSNPKRNARRKVGWVVLGAVAAAAASSLTASPALAQGARPTPTPEERAAALTRPSVVYVETHWSGYVFDEDNLIFNGGAPFEFTARCTGFVVDPAGYVASAGHCVDHANQNGAGETFLQMAVAEAVAKRTYVNNDPQAVYDFATMNWRVEGKTPGTRADKQVFVQRGTATAGKTDGEVLPARVVDFRPLEQGDVALLKVEKTDLPAIEVGNTADVQIGTSVLSVGYPGSTDQATDSNLEPTNKDGKVSAKKTMGTVSFLEMSAALSGGMSGGPTVDLEGRVVGVNSWNPVGEDQAFNFVAPASNLTELLSRNGVKNQLGPQDLTYRAGLDAYWAGRYTEAIAAFDKVTSIIPSHQQAQEYRQLAAKNRELFGDAVAAAPAKKDGGLPLLPIGAGVLLLAALGGGAALLTTRKGKAASGPAAGYAAPVAPAGPLGPPAPPQPMTHQPAAAEPQPMPVPSDVIPVQQPSVADSPVAAAPAKATRARRPSAASAARAAETSAQATPPKAAAFCSSCGAPRSPSAAFCGGCGSPLA